MIQSDEERYDDVQGVIAGLEHVQIDGIGDSSTGSDSMLWDDSPAVLEAILQAGNPVPDDIEEWDDSPDVEQGVAMAMPDGQDVDKDSMDLHEFETVPGVVLTAGVCIQSDSEDIVEWDDSPDVIEAILAAGVSIQTVSEDIIVWDESPDIIEALLTAGSHSKTDEDTERIEACKKRRPGSHLQHGFTESGVLIDIGISLARNAAYDEHGLADVDELTFLEERQVFPSLTANMSHHFTNQLTLWHINGSTAILCDVVGYFSYRCATGQSLYNLLSSPASGILVSSCVTLVQSSKLCHSSSVSKIGEFHSLGLPSSVGGRFVHREVEPDGNCFYRSVSMAIFGTEDGHPVVRIACLWAMAVWSDGVTAALKRLSGGSFTENVLETARNRAWSLPISPLLASAATKRRIITLFTFTERDMRSFSDSPFESIAAAASLGKLGSSASAFLAFDADRMREPVYLHFDRKSHYRSLLKKYHNARDLWVSAAQLRL